MIIKRLLQVFLSLAGNSPSVAENAATDENFMLVLRELQGASKSEFGFEPAGPQTVTLGDGKTAVISPAWFDLIGDMSVRFVSDGERTMRNLTTEEFSALGLTAEQAAEIAIANIKRRYGAPESSRWENGIMLVSGKSPDLDSSYFLDRDFWERLLRAYPDGLIVGVPKRGGLLYAPVSDRRAVSSLEQDIQRLYETSGTMRVSAALYLFKDSRWTMHRRPASLH